MSNSNLKNNSDIQAWKDEVSSCSKLEKKYNNKEISDIGTDESLYHKDPDLYNILKQDCSIENHQNFNETTDLESDNSSQEPEKELATKKTQQKERVIFDTEKSGFYVNELSQYRDNRIKKSVFSFLKNANTLDKKTEKKLKSGNYPIDATLDLHGLNLDKAHTNLMNFLDSAIKMKLRCLLVVTGKGLHSDKNSITIKEEFPNWVYHFGIKSHIITYTKAHKKHGGDGAFYILLRRQK